MLKIKQTSATLKSHMSNYLLGLLPTGQYDHHKKSINTFKIDWGKVENCPVVYLK